MQVGRGAGNPPQVLGTDEQSGIEKVKQEKNQQQTATPTAGTQASPKEKSSKKSEQALAGQAQATALRWKMDQEGVLKPILQRGSKGKQVEVLQTKLNDYRSRLGLPLITEDGKYGPETEKAVREFQKSIGMHEKQQDGIAGIDTQKILGLHLGIDKIGSSGYGWVRLDQEMINDHRKREGLEPIKEDDIFGPETQKAVREFQKRNGLKPDGVVGPETLALLLQGREAARMHRQMEEEAKVMQIEDQSKVAFASYKQTPAEPAKKSESLAEKGRKVAEWVLNPLGPSVEADPEKFKNLRDAAESIVDKSEELLQKAKKAAEEVDPFLPLGVDSKATHSVG